MKSNSASHGRLDKGSKSKKHEATEVSKPNHTENSQNSDQNLDPALKQKVQQVINLTRCTQDNAILALHDSDNDVNAAVILLLESDNMINGWQEQKTKGKKKQAAQATPESEDMFSTPTDTDNDDGWKENRHTEGRQNFSNARNAPPRLQRGGRREYRSRDDGGKDGSSGGGFNSERRFGGGRGRGRSRGGQGRGGFNRDSGGFHNRGGFGRNADNHTSSDRSDSANTTTQIGTWTSEADANPKTDSWGEVYTADEDNQWQGDLKGTHVFESSNKVDTFPTPTDFDPASAASLPTVTPPQQQQQHSISSSMNGGSSTQLPPSTANSMGLETSFLKQSVDSIAQPSVSLYDAQFASDSIKSAIGIPTQQQQLAEESAAKSSKGLAGSSLGISPTVGMPQSQRPSKQQRSKLPPPSTKIPTAPVEMPRSTGGINQLGVQFGADLPQRLAAGLAFDSSTPANDVSFSATSSSAVSSSPSLHQMQSHQSVPNPLYASSAPPQQTSTGLDPIPFPHASATNSQLSQQQGSRGQHQGSTSSPNTAMYHGSSSSKSTSSSHHSSYGGSPGPSTHYKPSQTSSHAPHSSHTVGSASGSHHLPVRSLSSQTQQNADGSTGGSSASTGHSAQSFHSGRSSSNSGNSNFYQVAGQDTDRGSGSHTYTQSSTSHHQQSAVSTLTSHTQQYTNSLYSSNEPFQQQQSQPPASTYPYNSGVSSVTSLSGAISTPISSHITQSPQSQSAVNSSRTHKPPPNLPHPANTGAGAAMMPPMPSYIMGGAPPSFYGQGGYYTQEDLQKYQQMLSSNAFYDQNQQYALNTTTIGAFQAGSGDAKMTRIDAQSPTVQGTQSTASQNQQQTAPSNTAQGQGHQQPQQFMAVPPGYNYYHYHAATPYGMYAPGVGMPGGAGGIYANQQKSGIAASNATSSMANSYYGGSAANNSGYDDIHSVHSNDYSKNVYGGGGKQNTNLTGSAANSSELSSLYKPGSTSQNNPAAVAATMYGGNHAAYMASQHLLAGNPHLIQSQIAAASANAQDGSGSVRGSQSSNMNKSHAKPSYYNTSSSNWGNN